MRMSKTLVFVFIVRPNDLPFAIVLVRERPCSKDGRTTYLPPRQ